MMVQKLTLLLVIQTDQRILKLSAREKGVMEFFINSLSTNMKYPRPKNNDYWGLYIL